MFNVVLNDGNPLPEDDICYIIAKEGVFLKKKLGIMESIAPVKNISILESIAASATMHITKIPAKWIAKTHSFFKEVYRQYRSEAIVLLFYNEETGQHKIIPPTQKVAGASCDYDKGITIDGYTMIGTIHSHGSMSAFHSGIDDSDEEHFDGLHITLGHLNDAYPSISASIVANGYRVVIEPSDYIENLVLMQETNPIEKDKSVTTSYKWENGELVVDKVTKNHYSYYSKKYDRRYDVVVSDRDRIFNKKWMNMVERGTYTYKSYRGGWQSGFYGHGGYYGGWGQHYDRSAWAQAGKHLPVPVGKGKTTSPYNVGPAAKTNPAAFPPHNADGEMMPCVTCVHRQCKIIDEINDEDYEEYYLCKKCGQVVQEEEGTILQCLGCLTDEHLVQLDRDQVLVNNYIQGEALDYEGFDDVAIMEPGRSSFVKCKACGNGYHLIDGDDSICPFCQTPISEEYSTEAALEGQSERDSGALLDSEAEEANEAALEAARQADETIERIPEPGSNSIPIPEKKESKLREMFRRAFGGGSGYDS